MYLVLFNLLKNLKRLILLLMLLMEKLRLIKDEILFVGYTFSEDRHLKMGDVPIKICVLFFFTKNEGVPHGNPGSSWRQ